MIKRKIYGFLKLIRLGVSIFGCISLIISGILAGDLRDLQTEYFLAILIVFITAAGAFAINDYLDYEIDISNNRSDRPIVLNLISRRTALFTAMSSFLFVLILGIFLNLLAMIFVYINLLLFYLYSFGLKKILFFKNILVAYSYVATILLGSIVSDSVVEPLIIYFSIMAFIVGLANEIMFDIADLEGDQKGGIKTLPMTLGLKKTAIIVVILYVIIVILDPLPFFVNIDDRLYYDIYFLILIMIPVLSYVILSRSLIKNHSKENISKLRIYIFIIMQIGTFSYLIGVII